MASALIELEEGDDDWLVDIVQTSGLDNAGLENNFIILAFDDLRLVDWNGSLLMFLAHQEEVHARSVEVGWLSCQLEYKLLVLIAFMVLL